MKPISEYVEAFRSQTPVDEDTPEVLVLLRNAFAETLTHCLEQRDAEWKKVVEEMEKIHKMELDAISLKSLEGFISWSEDRKTSHYKP